MAVTESLTEPGTGAAPSIRHRSTTAEIALGLGVFAAIVVPRGAPAVLLAVTLATTLEALWHRRLNGAALLRPDAFASACLGLAGLAMLSTLWQAAPAPSLEHGATFAGIILLTWLLVHALPLAEYDERRRLAVAACFGFAMAAAVAAVEQLSGMQIHRAIYNLIPELRPAPSGYFERDGVVIKIRTEQINRTIAALTLFGWPTLAMALSAWPALLTWPQQGLSRIQICAVGVGLAMLTAILGAGHQSSQLAVAVSVPAFALALWRQRTALRALGAGWLVLTSVIVPIALTAYHGRTFETAAIQDSGRARLIIWGVTAERVLEAPVLGIGAGAGQVLDAAETSNGEPLPGQPIDRRTGAHQHNVYLQVCYELGLLGACFLYVGGVIALSRIRSAALPAGAAVMRPAAIAAFAAAAAMAAVSYGLWQPWFQAQFAWMVTVLVIAAPSAWAASPPVHAATTS